MSRRHRAEKREVTPDAKYGDLVLAKFMLIADTVWVVKIFKDKALVYSILFKSAVYAAILVCMDILEEVIVGMFHGKPAAHGMTEVGGGGMKGIVLVGIMAFVLQFAPQDFVRIPIHGTIQYHPSLLPKYRGPSSINWPIIKGDTETGLTIFRPSDGLDEGAVILQKKTPISPDDTLGTVYFDRLFPMGVQAMLEGADLVVAGKHTETAQDESRASYEGWCRSGEAKIDWAKPVDHVYNLVRGCNPAPGAWTTLKGKKLQIFDARKTLFRRFADVPGKIGEVTDITEHSFKVVAQGGAIEVLRGKFEDGKKVSGGEAAKTGGIGPGTLLGG